MSFLYYKNPLKRKLQLEPVSSIKDFSEVDGMLGTLYKKIEGAQFSLENLDNVYKNMVGENTSKNETRINEPRSKSKRHDDKSIFYDIFIKPKENKIKELRVNKNETKIDTDKKIESDVAKNKVFISNKEVDMDAKDKLLGEKDSKEYEKNKETDRHGSKNNINIGSSREANTPHNKHSVKHHPNASNTQTLSEQNLNPSSSTGSFKVRNVSRLPSKVQLRTEELDAMKLNLSSFMKHNIEDNNYANILTNFLNSKFIPKDDISLAKKNFFNQQIQIQPPEGINAAVTAPIDPTKGWAPSIPAVQIDKNRTNLGDLIMRAKGGIQAGDIPKEAHMAFFLGIMNEEGRNYEEALKFYKKYFLSTKLLQDIYGMELALNRIGVLYSNMLDFNQSLYYHEKHRNITTHNIKGFVAYYNSGICLRIIGKIDEAIKHFNKAFQISEEESDIESYTICLCQLSICHLFLGNINAFIEYSNQFFSKNQTLKHAEMELEMQMFCQFVYALTNKLDLAERLSKKSLDGSKQLNNTNYKLVSMCNIGIIQANKNFDEFLNSLDDV